MRIIFHIHSFTHLNMVEAMHHILHIGDDSEMLLSTLCPSLFNISVIGLGNS